VSHHSKEHAMALRPARYRDAVIPHIYVDGAAEGIAFYACAFGARELFRIARPDGRILHAELSIEGATLMIGDPDGRIYGEPRALDATSASLHILCDDNAALLVAPSPPAARPSSP
jgi:PhnB protein